MCVCVCLCDLHFWQDISEFQQILFPDSSHAIVQCPDQVRRNVQGEIECKYSAN